MDRKITVWLIGLFLLLAVFPWQNTGASDTFEPQAGKYYRLKIDTLGSPDVGLLGYLSADTTVYSDSLKVASLFDGDMALWQFQIDSIVVDNDTVWYQIYNKGAGYRLAFNVPEADDTIASVQPDGSLNQWRIPFAILENGIGKLQVTDTIVQKDYFLGMRDDSVMLISDTIAYRFLSFICDEYIPFDTTKIYRVKYLNGDSAGKYLGVNVFGTDTLLLDAVYGHIPDGQFVVCRENTWMLRSRVGAITLAQGGYTAANDSLQSVTVGGMLLENTFTNGVDTFEIVTLTNGEVNPTDARIGYKYLTEEEQTDKIYAINYYTDDVTNMGMLGYRAADSIAFTQNDSAFFLIAPVTTTTTVGADIADITALEKTAYRFRSLSRPQLYLSVRDDSLIVDEAAKATAFYLKKDTTRNVYAFIDADEALSRKMFVASDRRLYMSSLDSVHTHWFEITAKDNPATLPMKFIVDTTMIYKVKYLNGADSGKYLGADMFGYKKLFDTVYSHLPDGQFVVRSANKFTLDSRIGRVRTGRYDAAYDYFNMYDSLKAVFDDGIPVANQFTNTVDTFEIVAIDYGDIEKYISNQWLGYKHFTQDELTIPAYAISYQSNDALNDAFIDYDDLNMPCILTSDGIDTVRFVVEASFDVYLEGADAIGALPKLRRRAYRFASAQDTTYFLRMRSDSIIIMYEPNSLSDIVNQFFYLKEDTIPDTGNYVFIIKTEYINRQAKMFVDNTRQLYMDPLDSVHSHVFKLIEKERYVTEADPYTYMKQLLKDAGLYEITTTDIDGSMNYLTRNFYSNAVFRKEGESTLRAGSYTPTDFHLWVDSTQGPENKTDRPSFYIIRDVDTLMSNFNVSGYFFHVMDSSGVSPNTDNIVTVDGKLYNRVNFVQATRASANELLLDTSPLAQLRDSVGFAGKNEKAINEFRFYFQQAPQLGKYYIVTEQGYGGKPGVRGYLSANRDGILYFGPRDGTPLSVTVSLANMVKNEAPPRLPIIVQEEEETGLAIVGGNGMIYVRNGAGQYITIFNVVGQQIANRLLDSDSESIPAQRGIAIVRIENGKTYKVVVQ